MAREMPRNYRNFTEISLIMNSAKEEREREALNDVFLMFFGLHFVLSLLFSALEKFVKLGTVW